ncbi:MAG: carboxypeptidase-like regulatory domain-containing protein [Acidimicrobiales bacterium]
MSERVRRLRSTGVAVLAVGGLIGLLPSAASAVTLWSFVGKVTDPLGTPIAGATVSDGGQQTTTGSDGSYSLGENSAGTYDLTAIAANHAQQGKQVQVTLPVNTTVNFTLLYSISGALSNQYLSTVTGPVSSTLTITDWAPTSGSCLTVTDSRTGQGGAATLVTQNADGSSTWTYVLSVPQNATEGSYELSMQVTSCSSGIPWSTVGTTGYMVDNTPPTVSNPIPANNGNDLATPLVSFQAQDSLSGVKVATATLSLDGVAEPLSEANDGSVDLFSYTVPASQALATGTHSVGASVADNAGNVATYSWTFFVSSLSAVASPVLVDTRDTAAVPSTVSINEQVTMSNVLIDLPPATVVVNGSGHPGFGLACASVDLSSVEAQFPNDLGGYNDVAPTVNPGTQNACVYISDLTPGIVPHNNELTGLADSIGSLTFNVPATAKPGSTATLIFSGAAPTTNWGEPCYSVNAAPAGNVPIYEQVCDPIPNYIDTATASAAAEDLATRVSTMAGQSDFSSGSYAEPSVWTLSGGNYVLTSQPVNVNTFFPAAQYTQSLTYASPYDLGGPAVSVLYSETHLYKGEGSAASTIMERYFRWDSSYTGNSGQSSYLSMTWAGNYPETSSANALFDSAGNNLSQATDTAGHAIAWSAFQPNGASGVYGRVLGMEQSFTYNGASDRVQSGHLDETSGLGCTYCVLASIWFQDPAASDSFSVANGGPQAKAANANASASCSLTSTDCLETDVACTVYGCVQAAGTCGYGCDYWDRQSDGWFAMYFCGGYDATGSCMSVYYSDVFSSFAVSLEPFKDVFNNSYWKMTQDLWFGYLPGEFGYPDYADVQYDTGTADHWEGNKEISTAYESFPANCPRVYQADPSGDPCITSVYNNNGYDFYSPWQDFNWRWYDSAAGYLCYGPGTEFDCPVGDYIEG